jgi:WD40 repeat protein
MADVFISYSQRAPEPTHALASVLIEHGIDAWFDVNLLPGDVFGKVIDGEIDRAKAVITIWSRPALTSTWVPAESQRAFDQGKLLCVRMQDVSANELPTPFNRLQTPLVTDTDAILAGLAAKGVRQGKASLGEFQAEHGTMGEAALAWQSVKDSTDLADIEAFIEFYYAAAFYRLLANRKLERLRTRIAAEPSRQSMQVARAEDVFLRIEARMHTVRIRRISLSADGRMMATGSDDKTVRLWSLPDGKLARTLRLPIGSGNDGKVYAVALAQDGRWVAAGMWHRSEAHRVVIFDTETGSILAQLGPLPHVTADLEVSPRGDRLAAGFGGKNGVRVWETTSWNQVAEDRDYCDNTFGLSFALDSRLATTSDDGYIRLYGPDVRLNRKIKAPGGAHPSGISFSPDGTKLVVGYDNTTRLDVLSGQTLAPLFEIDTSGVGNGDLCKVAWLRDGTRVAAAGRFVINGERPILLWTGGGAGRREMLPGSTNTILALETWGGGLAFGGGGPAFGLVGADGKRALFRGPPIADMRNKVREHFLVSVDGTRVRFGLQQASDDPVIFDVEAASLGPSPAAPADLHQADTTSVEIDGWNNSRTPKLKIKGRFRTHWVPLPLDPHETARSIAIAPDSRTFVLGTEWRLRRFEKDGKPLWNKPVPDVVWGVNLAREGRLIIAAYADGTIRWHCASDGEELLALFIHVPDDPEIERRWVLWTPEGYYTASPGGEDLVGWHVNRGLDQAADFYPAATFRSTFHRPQLVAKALDQANCQT